MTEPHSTYTPAEMTSTTDAANGERAAQPRVADVRYTHIAYYVIHVRARRWHR